MIRIIPFSAEHLKLMADPATEPGLLEALSANPRYWQVMSDCPTAFSAFAAGVYLGSGGFALMPWPGVAMVWLWAMPAAKKYPLRVHRFIIDALNHIEERYEVQRIECQVKVGNELARRWVEILGFKNETENGMKRWGPGGTDYWLYARVRD